MRGMADQALLVMDVQTAIVERFADGSEALLASLRQAAGAARAARVPVIFVRVAFRPGAPEVSPRNRSFAAAAAAGGMEDGAPGSEVHPALDPGRGDLVVVKKRVSAFAGSDLQVVLRSLGVRSLVLAGIATSGVVLSTLRQAADLDYGLAVLRDGCLDRDPEVHRVLMDRVFPRQAEVLSVAAWASGLEDQAPGGM